MHLLGTDNAFCRHSRSEIGGIQSSKRQIFTKSACKNLHKRCAISGGPKQVTADFSHLIATNKSSRMPRCREDTTKHYTTVIKKYLTSKKYGVRLQALRHGNVSFFISSTLESNHFGRVQELKRLDESWKWAQSCVGFT